ncbi:MAG: cyclic nucleotide-binding protein [Rhodocyclaceae bacterium]|nr:MAG: cyclic nucleotide-binding protein [Rhodocyclaceae bacterium]TND05968.1 MAG: cyclic nucleotide-binding protein [Rhodocyclaceae bacterium]
MSIRKLVVANGIYYVEIPAAGLYLLCGAPADSVKHLFRRGIIQTSERNGVTFENGPNAILLSDSMIQNGHLCNLAEFPILQMLYRQGMLIPNHPNNVGNKPKLIGTPEQLAAQLRYIHRGNYGLISAEEMMRAGIDEAEANELMRVKLKFAFGQIAKPDTFVDCWPLTTGSIEIGDGVSITRLAHNVFEIRHGEDSVQVDLNLGRNETYPCPYPLSHAAIDRHYFAVVHTGDGDGWDYNRPVMGSVVIHQGRVFLIDAGPNIHYSLDALGIGKKEVAGIFHTHCHDDHFAGLTTLLQCDQPLQYFATPLVRASVTRKFCALLSIPESEFARYFDIHDLEVDKWNDIMGLEVRPIVSPHPVETTIFNFRVLWEGGYRTYSHLADIASFNVIDAMTCPDASAPGLSPERARDVKAAYLEPVDLKKIDIGGGMIHGSAADFAGDESTRLLLAHTARELTDAERRIGSGAPFGTLDVLIPGQQNFLLRDASEFLKSYFPAVPMERLHMLLNNRIVTFNPETIISPAGKIPDEIYLLLAGKVEMLTQDPSNSHFLFSGSLLGESAAIYNRESEETYRSVGFVQALRLPSDLYRNFIERFYSSTELIEVRKVEEKLRRTFLFSDAVTNTTLFSLAKHCRITQVHAGENFVGDPEQIHLIGIGRLCVGEGEGAQVLGKGEFWGSDSLFSAMSEKAKGQQGLADPPHALVALDSCEIYSVPLKLVSRIPVVRWKLFEAFRNTHPYAAPRFRGTPR